MDYIIINNITQVCIQDQIYWLFFFKEEAWEYDRVVTKLLVTCSLILHTPSQLINDYSPKWR